jgi:hypothetical protein
MLGWAIFFVLVAFFFFAKIEVKHENTYNGSTTIIYKPSNSFFMKVERK